MQMAGHPISAPCKRSKPKPFNRTDPFITCHCGFHFERVLIENKIPGILAPFIFKKVNIVIFSFHFKIDRAFAIPPIHNLFHLVSAIAKLEGNGPFFYLITCMTFYLNHGPILCVNSLKVNYYLTVQKASFHYRKTILKHR